MNPHQRRIRDLAPETATSGGIYLTYCVACSWTIIDRLSACNLAWDNHLNRHHPRFETTIGQAGEEGGRR